MARPKKQVQAVETPAAQALRQEPAVVTATPSHETYKIIRRADRYLVEITLWGRVLHDSKDYARPEDALVRLDELTKGHK